MKTAVTKLFEIAFCVLRLKFMCNQSLMKYYLTVYCKMPLPATKRTLWPASPQYRRIFLRKCHVALKYLYSLVGQDCESNPNIISTAAIALFSLDQSKELISSLCFIKYRD